MWPFFVLFKRRSSTAPMLMDATYSHVRADPLNANATFTLQSDGRASGTGTATPSEAASYIWLDSGVGSLYDVNATLSSGSTPTGSAVGSWLSLGTTRSWTASQTVPGVETCVLSVAIRPAGGGATITTKSITLYAEVTEFI